MIKANFVYENGNFKSMEIKGHAGSGPYGHDLVCAGVSAVTFGGLNALEEEIYEVDEKEGYLLVIAKRAPNTHDSIVLETIERQVTSLSKSYPDNLRAERKGK